MTCSIAAAVLGIALAGIIYLTPRQKYAEGVILSEVPQDTKPKDLLENHFPWAEKIATTFRPLYLLSFNKFFVDEIYSKFIVRPFVAAGKILFGFDESVVDGAVNGAGFLTAWTSKVKNWIDIYIVDGLVNFMGVLTYFFNNITKRLQTGFIQNYLLFVFIGIVALIIFEFKLTQ